jgi:PEGA domain
MRALVIALVIALVVIAGATAHADRDKSEKYFAAGAAAYKQQSFAAAAEQFELAYKELALPEIAFSAAQAYRRQYFVDPKPEYVKRAVELYRIYLDQVKSGGRVGDASDGVAEMQRELDRLTASGQKIGDVKRDATRLAVSVEAPGAKATLDGKPIELFAPIVCAAGPHTVEVTADGFASAKLARQVVEGTTELVDVPLEPLPAKLTIHTDDGAAIAIDGHTIGVAPLDAQPVAAGPHVVAITRRGRVPVERTITLARGGSQTLDVPLAMTGRRKVVPWLGLAAGVVAAGAIATTIVAVHYDNQMQSLDAERLSTGITIDQLGDYRRDVRLRDDLRDTAGILGGVAVAAGLTTLALYYFDLPTLGERATAIVPAATPTSAGITVSGRF